MSTLNVFSRRMLTLAAVTFMIFFTGSVVSIPPPQRCSNPVIRREWRDLSVADRKAYLKAVQCVLKKPGITPRSVVPGVVSRYDDIVATHQNQTFNMHYVGHFLPWHRYVTAYYENVLRNECGYKGGQPYWDWHRDVGKGHQAFLRSPIFDPVTGFGGNGPYIATPGNPMAVPGRTGGGCVPNGPFKDMTVRIGPLDDNTGNPRCLSRDFSSYFSGRYLAANQTKVTLQATNFYDFDVRVEGGPSFEASGIHGGGHYGIGGTLGTMGDLYVSLGDPVFWLHHSNLDRVWWSWQKLNWPARKTDFGGPTCLMDYWNPATGQRCPNATLSQPMDLGYNHPGLTVADVMDIKGGYLCYEYDTLLDPRTL